MDAPVGEYGGEPGKELVPLAHPFRISHHEGLSQDIGMGRGYLFGQR